MKAGLKQPFIIRSGPGAVLLGVYFLLTSVCSGYVSIYSVGGMGLEQNPYDTRGQALGGAGMAFIRDYGSSITNPSKTGFNTKTTFEAAFNSDLIHVQEESGMSNTLTGARIPFIGMNFQAGKYGNIGLSYFQKFDKNFEYKPEPGAAAETQSIEYMGGSYEVITSIASQAYYNYSIGLSYHIIWGRDQMITRTNFSDPELRDITGDTLTNRWSGGYPAISFSYKAKRFSFALSSSFWQKIEKNMRRNTNSLSVNPEKKKGYELYDLPVTVGFGVYYRLAKNKHLVCDLSTSDWDQTIDKNINRSYRFGTGYEYKGTGGSYDSYYKRMTYRAGAGYEKHYLYALNTARITGGLGLPLGKRGSTLNLSLELGRRDVISELQVQENYLKFQFSFIGAGVWGRPSRRR